MYDLSAKMTDKKITVPILVGDEEEIYNIRLLPQKYEKILNGDHELLQTLMRNETNRRNITIVQDLSTNFNDFNQNLKKSETIESFENDAQENAKEDYKEYDDGKETFTWPEKAIMLFLELYRERKHEFTGGLKRHKKLWSEIASELQKSNYNVSGVQVQNKMSGLKRTYKKIKDSNAKSGNNNSCWVYYPVMNALFGKEGWVSPLAVASSDGPNVLSTSLSSTLISLSPSSSVSNFECQNIPPKPKKRKVEAILDSYISKVKSNRDRMREEKKKEREKKANWKLEKEVKREQRWEINRKEKKLKEIKREEMHKETLEIQRSLVGLLDKLIEKQNKLQ